MILMESKKLNGSGLLQKANANNITADKILYEYAIQMVSLRQNPISNLPFSIEIVRSLNH